MEPYFAKYDRVKIGGMLAKSKLDYMQAARMKGFTGVNGEETICLPYVLGKCGFRHAQSHTCYQMKWTRLSPWRRAVP